MKTLPLLVTLLLAASCSESTDFFAKRRDKVTPPSTTATVEETSAATPGSPSVGDGIDGSTGGVTTAGSTTSGSSTSGTESGTTSGSNTSGSNSGTTTGSTTSGSNSGTTSGSTTSGSESGTTSGSNTSGSNSGTTSGSTTSGTTSGSTTSGSNSGTTSGSSTSGSNSGTTSGSSTSGSNSGTTSGSTSSGSNSGSTEVNMIQESFTQKSAKSKMLDILWVVDNSASMADEQEDLARNLNSFIHQFTQENIDFKMAITTTDTSPGKKGMFNPYGPYKLNTFAHQNNASQFFTDFNTLVRVGIKGSGKEKGLEAIEGFSELYSKIFLRKDANLAVIILSDENDQSPKAAALYAQTIKALKGKRGGLVKVHSIVDLKLSNKASGITLGYDRYAKVSKLTGGSISDIRSDFSSVLSDLGTCVAQQMSLRSFSLAQKPQAGTVKVYVNGNISTDYTVDMTSNTVVFNEGSTPDSGAEIMVVYKHVKE